MKLVLLNEAISGVRDIIKITGRRLEHVSPHFREAMIDQLWEMADHYEVDEWYQAWPRLVAENYPQWQDRYQKMQSGFTAYRLLRLQADKDGSVDFSSVKNQSFGIHWSTERLTDSDSFGMNQDIKNWSNWKWVSFYAHITGDQVNWPDTITANFMPDDQGDEEQEVVLKNGAHVHIEGYFIDTGRSGYDWTNVKKPFTVTI